MTPFRLRHWCLKAWMSLLASLALLGCEQTSRDLALDVAGARLACQQALLAWQEGKQPADLKPDIIVGDRDWKSGRKLVSFELLEEEEFNDGTNLHIPVALTLQNADGQESTARALYVVGTSPVVTVFRD